MVRYATQTFQLKTRNLHKARYSGISPQHLYIQQHASLRRNKKKGLFTLSGAKQMFLGSENFCFVFISCTARFFVNFENLRNISICKPDIQPIFSRGSESTKMARWLNIENDIKNLVYQITGFQVFMQNNFITACRKFDLA